MSNDITTEKQKVVQIRSTKVDNYNLNKIRGFYGGYYEERRLLEYKTPVCTSQETQYVSITEHSQLMLCKI
jgi:hypothetical protein